MFTKEERSSFPYWFAHWSAFQMTALNHRMWRPKYLFHDWEKPWLKLLFPYEKVQKWHRHHHNHHLEWLEDHLAASKNTCINKVIDAFDWEGMVIDWDCSRFTKEASPQNAREKKKKIYCIKGLAKYPHIFKWSDVVNDKINEVFVKYGF